MILNLILSVVVGGMLGHAIDAGYDGRLAQYITGPDSYAINLFSPEKIAQGKGGWQGEHAGKWLYAASKAYERTGDPALLGKLTSVADYLISRQEKDGYLGCYREDKRYYHRPGPDAMKVDWDTWIMAYLIKGFTEAMTDGTIPPEMHEKYLKIISGETDRLVKMTQDILRLNDMDQNKVILTLSDFDINEELKKTAAVFEGSCRKKKISIDLVLSGETFLVHADREKIEQVIYNLLDNAIKFSGKNSAITLETTEKFGKCYVSVKDEGIGIPSSEITSIWERFYKGDSSRGKDRKGTGLGLAIVREIIQAHGQRINVISTVGVGTEFVFTLDPA